MFYTSNNSTAIGVGFGTAALGGSCFDVVGVALEAGFRNFDTAEADWWYDQTSVGRALSHYFLKTTNEEEDQTCVSADVCGKSCQIEDLRISTKIPPWSLTSFDDIRAHAAASREELLGFCDDLLLTATDENTGIVTEKSIPYPLDVYYIHAPACWKGWHPRCDNPPPTLDLRSAWQAMEAVVGLDHSAKRIGLSNVRQDELLDIIQFVKQRQESSDIQHGDPPPRKPDVVQAFADPIRPADEIRKICREHDIEFVSYSTL
jgi:diketogulonate reductase-like aldo/keto reductase